MKLIRILAYDPDRSCLAVYVYLASSLVLYPLLDLSLLTYENPDPVLWNREFDLHPFTSAKLCPRPF